MLSQRLISYLSANADPLPVDVQTRYARKLQELLFDQQINSDFTHFMTKYSDEYYGAEGLIPDVMNDDLMNYEVGTTQHLIKNYKVPSHYVSLFNLETDDYLLYNKSNDAVKLILGKNMAKLPVDAYYDRLWSSFNEFMEHFFYLS